MNVDTINTMLSLGNLAMPGLFPKLEELNKGPIIFKPDIGLEQLPTQPGLLTIRGARQYGKSTWLEQELKKTVEEFGPMSAFYLNGDEISSMDQLREKISNLCLNFKKMSLVKRLFIDEITAIPNWEKAIKRLVDAGELSEVLIITTGSKCSDLRRGTELLPGRKGKLDRNTYFFLPIPYSEFKRVCAHYFSPNDLLTAYLISGGSPLAIKELALQGRIPDYVTTLTRDWIFGEFASTGRQRGTLIKLFELLHKHGGTPAGYSKLAREADLANNTVASGYIELLSDLFCILPGFSWDLTKKVSLLRKPCKFHWINLLAAVTFSPEKIRSIKDFDNIPGTQQGKWWEWLVAQELWRKQSLTNPEPIISLDYWNSSEHEIDFITDLQWYEVKKGSVSPLEFTWFSKMGLKNTKLKIINKENFETNTIIGIDWESFLLE